MEYVVDSAAGSNNLKVIKYLVEEKGGPISDYAVYWALAKNRNDIARYLLGDEVVDKEGNVYKLPHDKESGQIIDAAFKIALSNNNNLDFIKYLLSKGAKITTELISSSFSQFVQPNVFAYLQDLYFSNKK